MILAMTIIIRISEIFEFVLMFVHKNYLYLLQETIKLLSRTTYNTLGIQFGNVTILVPPYWKDSRYKAGFNLAPESADIIIQPLKDKNMYTQHILGCGSQSLFMAIDASYVKEIANSKGNTFSIFYNSTISLNWLFKLSTT